MRRKEALKTALRIRPLYGGGPDQPRVALPGTPATRESGRSLREALAQNPGSVEARVGLGEVLKKAGELEEAVESFRKFWSRRQATSGPGSTWRNFSRPEGKSGKRKSCSRRPMAVTRKTRKS